MDQGRYVECLKKSLPDIDTDIDSVGMLDNMVRKLNDVLDSCAKAAAPKAKARPRKARLKVWTPGMRKEVEAKQKVFYEWKTARRPQDKAIPEVTNKKQTTILLRKICRREDSNKMLEDRQNIMNSKSSDMALFHKLINKQRVQE